MIGFLNFTEGISSPFQFTVEMKSTKNRTWLAHGLLFVAYLKHSLFFLNIYSAVTLTYFHLTALKLINLSQNYFHF